MIKRDYYEVLEISKQASGEEIKKAYRQSALKYHPDRNPGDKVAEENFKLASEAYEVLSDSQKRQIYDQYGHAGLSGTDFHPFHNVEDIFSSFGDVFEDFFGFSGRGGKKSRRPRRGDDFRYDLPIEFIESYTGCEKEIKVRKEEECEECEGLGHPVSSKPATCPTCQGRGEVYHTQGFFRISSTCSHCHGEGEIVKILCKVCSGAGHVEKEKKLKVKVPAGVESGNRLVLRGEGGPGTLKGPPGDLYVVLMVKDHPHFHREGLNLCKDFSISMTQAALGDKVPVELLDETTEVEIPEGIDSEETVVLKGKGFADLRGGKKGDLILKIHVTTPTHLTERQREILQEFSDLEKDKPVVKEKKSKKKKGFWG